jgi:hypothetical protein
MMEDWLQRLATELGVDPLSDEQQERLLEAARDVAHDVERKVTPLAAFLLGAAMQRAIGHGLAHDEAFAQVLAELRGVL